MAGILVVETNPSIGTFVAAVCVLGQTVGQPTRRWAAVVVNYKLYDVAATFQLRFCQGQGVVFGIGLTPGLD